MSEEKQSVFFGGIPTDIDVQKIVEAIDPKPGVLVPYGRIEEIIGHAKEESRFASVVGAWRRLLKREHNLLTEGVRNEGILILTPDRRVDHVGRRVKRGAKAIKRAHTEAALTPREDLPVERVRQLDHFISLSGALITIGQQMERSKLPPKTNEEG